MEPAQIDWKRIDSRFVEDVFYEHLRAPKWFDFLAPNSQDSIDDEAWFCKPDCNHPKKPEDFLLLTPTSSKVKRYALSPSTSNNQESENQNSNLTTPSSHQANSWRSVLTSTSSVKKMAPRRLKSTQSARNLFSGRDIFGHISEFCYELKRLATRVTEREESGKSQVKESHQVGDGLDLKKERKPLLEVSKEKITHEFKDVEGLNQPYSGHGLDLIKERKPLLEVGKEKTIHESKDVKESTFKENRRRKKRVDDAENIPVILNVKTIGNKGEDRRKKRVDEAENTPPSLKLENTKNKGHERLLQIRTNPPSPQCFSENRTATLKASKAKAATEVVKRKEEEEEEEKSIKREDSKEGRGLDVLWFLKPCTLAN